MNGNMREKENHYAVSFRRRVTIGLYTWGFKIKIATFIAWYECLSNVISYPLCLDFIAYPFTVQRGIRRFKF